MNNKKKMAQMVREKTGKFPRGENNSITDIKGVKATHLTINKDFQKPSGKKISIRTGLTAILPYQMEKEMRLFTGSFILGGKNETTGYEVMEDFCYLNSPLVITNSFQAGRIYNAILSYGFSLNRVEIWPPYVIGLNDSYLNDMNESFILEKDILEALHNASHNKIEEGSVGIGLGLRAFNWKGGIGTSSRIFSLGQKEFTCGVLVASNHGNKKNIEKKEIELPLAHNEQGSLIIIVGVNLPLIPYQIKHLQKSLVVSLASINSLKNCSDSISCHLFSTANPMSMEKEGPFVYDFHLVNDSLLNQLILVGSEAIKEAILNSLLKATPIKGKLGRKVETIPDDEFCQILDQF